MCLDLNISVDEFCICKKFKRNNSFAKENLGVTIAKELKFDSRVKHIRKKAGSMLHAFSSTTDILSPCQNKTFFKIFIEGNLIMVHHVLITLIKQLDQSNSSKSFTKYLYITKTYIQTYKNIWCLYND